jgi:hypothetical protein
MRFPSTSNQVPGRCQEGHARPSGGELPQPILRRATSRVWLEGRGRGIMTRAPARPRPQAWRPVLVDPQPRQQIRFCATRAGARVAYATAGRGPALLVPAAWIGHLELAWQDPAVRAFYAPLAAHRTVVRYDTLSR